MAADRVVERAVELAMHLGSRTKASVASIKRAVYFGGSMSLTDGLHVERTEFLRTALSDRGQQLMVDYMASTDRSGELPLYSPGIYAQALEEGTVPAVAAQPEAR